jgi:hypothetical protein
MLQLCSEECTEPWVQFLASYKKIWMLGSITGALVLLRLSPDRGREQSHLRETVCTFIRVSTSRCIYLYLYCAKHEFTAMSTTLFPSHMTFIASSHFYRKLPDSIEVNTHYLLSIVSRLQLQYICVVVSELLNSSSPPETSLEIKMQIFVTFSNHFQSYLCQWFQDVTLVFSEVILFICYTLRIL